MDEFSAAPGLKNPHTIVQPGYRHQCVELLLPAFSFRFTAGDPWTLCFLMFWLGRHLHLVGLLGIQTRVLPGDQQKSLLKLVPQLSWPGGEVA